MKKLTTIIATLCCVAGMAQQQELRQELRQEQELRRGDRSIERSGIEAQIACLASDSLQGRSAGSAIASKTVSFVCNELKKEGYTPIIQKFRDSLQNIFCRFEGIDTSRVVIVGAHHDHLGVDPQGDVFNGADDNASGVVAVLQIARAFRTAGIKPAHTVVFALWDGEESGLLGSKHFVSNCIADSSSVLYYMNFDMIGRNSDETNPTAFSYMYTARTPQLGQWLSDAVSIYDLKLKPDYRAWDRPTSGSDNAPFARRGIPIAWYHTGGHPDYHKVTDTADKINYPKLIDIIRSAYYVAWQMAQ